MCSWCYAFAPEMERLREAAGDIPVSVLTGGLRFETEPMNDSRKTALRGHWSQIQEQTGRPFSYELLGANDFCYDTEPACRAVVTVRDLPDKTDSDDTSLDYFHALQSAFYADSRYINLASVAASVATHFGVTEQSFVGSFESDATKTHTANDFRQVRSMGVQGFPTVFLQTDDQFFVLTIGYQKYEDLARPLETWLRTGKL
ncbi:MAG: DsbA family protein [Woeseiaceae bacterium]|nr:DsbA family protein [Woeseiaceae bacterium]